MRNFWIIASISLSLIGCSNTLRQPELEVSNLDKRSAELDYNIVGKIVSPDTVAEANKSPFVRYVNVGSTSGGPVKREREANLFHGRKLPVNIRPEYKIGIGDVLTVHRSGYPNTEQGVRDVQVSSTSYVINENGEVFLLDGRKVLVEGLSISKAEAAISVALGIKEDGRPLTPDASEGFPFTNPRVYRLGAGDVVEVSRLITNSDSNGNLTQSIQNSQSVIGPDGVVSILQLGDVELSGLTLTQARNRVIQEAARNASGLEVVVDIKQFASQDVLISGAFGTRKLILTDKPLTYPELIAEAVGSRSIKDREYEAKLTRSNLSYVMPLDELLRSPAGDGFYVLDKDRLEILERLPHSEVTVAVSNANSQSVSYSRVTAGSFQSPVRTSSIVPFQLRGLDLRELLVSQGIDVGRNEDLIVRVNRGNTAYTHSAQKVLFENAREKFWLTNGDQIVVEDIAYVGENALLVGELRAPQRMPVDRYDRTSLSQALFNGGVFEASDADFRHVYVLRGEGLNYDAYHFDFTQVVNLALAEKFELRPADIVFVRTRPLSRYNRALALFLTWFGAVDAGLTDARTFGR